MMLIDLKNLYYPLLSLSELPDRLLGYNLSLTTPLYIDINLYYAIFKSKQYDQCKLVFLYRIFHLLRADAYDENEQKLV